MPNVKEKARLFREDFKTSYQSETTGGRKAQDCGPFLPSGKYEKQTDKKLVVKYLYNEVGVCYKTLIGTFKQNLLRAGAMFSEQNDALNDFLLAAIIRDNNIQTDKLIWHGDYKSAVAELSHYDGLVKKIAQATGTSVAEVNTFTFAGLVSGDVVEGRAGGQVINVPFITDNNTTAAAVDTALSALVDPVTGSLLYTATNAAGVVTVTANTAGVPNDILLVVTDGTGLNFCDEANVAGTGTVVKATTTANVTGDEPNKIAYTVITATNVIDELEKIFLQIQEKRPELLADPNFKVHVSNQVWAMLTVALTKETKSFIGTQVMKNAADGPFGLPIVNQPYLFGSLIAATSADNIWFGTDLVSDLSNAQTWIDMNCQEYRFRNETFQGVQVDRFDRIFCNFGAGFPLTFQAAQPE